MNKSAITLNLIIILLIISASIWVGMYIQDKGQDTVDFCKGHYKNETFRSDFIGDEPPVLKTCCLNQSKSFGVYYCKDYVDNYQECIFLNGTKDQIKFIG